MIKTLVSAMGFVAIVLMPLNTFADCKVNGVSYSTPFTIGPGQPHGFSDPCGLTVEASNGSACSLLLATDAVGAYQTDCLTLKQGVTFDLQMHFFTCPDAQGLCGSAVKVTATGNTTTTRTNVKNGSITGPWSTGLDWTASFSSANYGTVNDLYVDLTGPGYNGTVAMAGAPTISRVVLSNAGYGISGASSYKATDLIVHDCYYGWSRPGKTFQPTIETPRFSDNVIDLYIANSYPNVDTTVPVVKNGTFRNASDTTCFIQTAYCSGGACWRALPWCASLSVNNTSAVDDLFYP